MENRYIDNMEVSQALAAFLAKAGPKVEVEEIPVTESLGRFTASAVYAKLSSPPFNCAAMDGIAVKTQSVKGARPTVPVILKAGVDYQPVNTGNPIEEPYDAVIMKEDVVIREEGVAIYDAVTPWQHIRPVGEDIVATELVLPSRHKVRPFDRSAMISAGVTTLKVYKQPRVAILPTGSELVTEVSQVSKGHILDSNSYLLEGLVKEAHGLPLRLESAPDEFEVLKKRVQEAAKDCEILLIGAGSSAGTKDFTKTIVAQLGEVFVHGIAMKPGKPTILGKIDETIVVGIPGYPVSSYLSFETFVRPLLEIMTGVKAKDPYVSARFTQDYSSSLKVSETVRVTLSYLNGHYEATPTKSGAGVSMSLVRADGLVIIDQAKEGLNRGEEVPVRLLRDEEEIKNRLNIIGSHDVILDLLADLMPMTSTHVGSMGGVLARSRGETLLAPIHLLDESTGQYNLWILDKFFPQKDHCLIKGVGRTQGLIVAKGNPLKLQGIQDLSRPDITMINRQRGSGTRIFLDYLLKKEGMLGEDIKGYDREANTHTAVAAAVAQGSAQVGLGVYSAALALNLDFIPLGQEDYDFLVARQDLKDERVIQLVHCLRSKEFARQVELRGGYRLVEPGKIME